MESAQCACQRVEWRPKRFDDGTRGERWGCQDCGTEFVKLDVQLARECAEYEDRIAELEGELQKTRDSIVGLVKPRENRIEELETLLRRLVIETDNCGLFVRPDGLTDLVEEVRTLVSGLGR